MSIHLTRNSWILAYALAAAHDDFTSTTGFDEAVICGRLAADRQGMRRGPVPLFWRSPVAVYEDDEWGAAEYELAEDRAQRLFDEGLAELDVEDAKLIAESDALATPIEFVDVSGISQAEVDAIFGANRDDIVQAFFERSNREALSRAFAMPQFGQQQSFGFDAKPVLTGHGMLADAGWTLTADGWEKPPVVQSGNVAGGDIVGGDVRVGGSNAGRVINSVNGGRVINFVTPVADVDGAISYPVTGVQRDDGSIEHDSRGPGADARNYARFAQARAEKGLALSSGPVVDPLPQCNCDVCQRGL
jgi:hypothetical protein